MPGPLSDNSGGKVLQLFFGFFLSLTGAAVRIQILLISYINCPPNSRKADIWLSFTEPYL